MIEFLKLARRFGRDESGVFAVVFGVMAIVLVALGGAVVDYVTLEQTRSRAQTALDAAVLALQPEILKVSYDRQKITDDAEKFLIERIGDNRITASIEDTVISVDDGLLYFRAEVKMPTMFVSLVGVPLLSARVESEAVRKKLALEVVMVLDNSGSMASHGRMPALLNAAQCATYILMYDAVVDVPNSQDPTKSDTCIPAPGAQLVENVRIALVPFTMFVNVGANNANASWIDRTGASSIHFDNFDNDDDEDRLVLSLNSPNYSFPTRQTLFAATKENWRGCIEARPHIKSGTLSTEYLDTDDTPATGGNTLFVPMFSPDTVSGITGNGNNFVADSPAVCDRPAVNGSRCEVEQRRTRNNTNANWGTTTTTYKIGTGSPTNFVSNLLYPNAFYGALPPGCTCRSLPTMTEWSGSNTSQIRTGSCNSFVPTGLTNRELQERICKYYSPVTKSDFATGPNSQCTRTPILPLTENVTSIINAIKAMTAEGGTNIHEGAAWGFRVLSPGEPFDQGAAYNPDVKKVMILMTDGANTSYVDSSINGSAYNSAYGFPYNSMNNKAASTSGGTVERLGKLQAPSNTGAVGASNVSLETEMNTRTLQTCTNAKAVKIVNNEAQPGVEIYTIGLSTHIPADQSAQAALNVVANRQMLTNCADNPTRAHFPDEASELKQVFVDIANELTSLRLTR
jgi:Flp pilus assembly protein TadG